MNSGRESLNPENKYQVALEVSFQLKSFSSMSKWEDKLKILSQECFFEKTGYSRRFFEPSSFIYQSTSSEGSIRLFKILLTNFCQNNCLYCGQRLRRNSPRYIISPRELARMFMELYKNKKVKGLFLSSGIYKNGQVQNFL